eukprot:TRINITY_DN14086_c0_g2_i1.p1 TRINITY_DN14086_c0_g2~~TRINITY_DN14086_c0_g2_i1.p1  ORF type:complete len:486 (+),score=68.54 TRINITY_DN14086_c0_g2_i1:117-1574(+)
MKPTVRLAALLPRPRRLVGQQISSSKWCHATSWTNARMVSSAAGAGLRSVGDADITALINEGRPMVIHCGARWSPASGATKARLAEWATLPSSSDHTVVCAATDLSTAPRFVRERGIRVIPSVLFFRAGRIERRADGGDEAELKRLLDDAEKYRQTRAVEDTEGDQSPLASHSPGALLSLAEDESHRAGGTWPASTGKFCRLALQVGPSDHDFHARVMLVRCLVQAAEEAAAGAPETHSSGSTIPASRVPSESAVQELEEVINDIYTKHATELRGENRNALSVAQLLAHAGLLLEAWTGKSPIELSHVSASATATMARDEALRHYAAGRAEEAVTAAIRSYRHAASEDIQGLAIAYAQPDRPVHIDDRLRPDDSVYSQKWLAVDAASPPGPALQRALLQRLFLALGPEHPIVASARANIATLLDRKEHIPFHTRKTRARKGGAPRKARGTGKRSGYSKFYWVAWEPFRVRLNTKKMGSPHCDKGD